MSRHWNSMLALLIFAITGENLVIEVKCSSSVKNSIVANSSSIKSSNFNLLDTAHGMSEWLLRMHRCIFHHNRG